MLLAGDELGRTQLGNNNAYCQDNEVSWINWEKADKEFQTFVKELIAFRKNHPAFCRKKWFQGRPVKGRGLEDISWFLPEGIEMTDNHWQHDFAKSLGVYLNGNRIHTTALKGKQVTDDSFYIVFNAYYKPLDFKLPPSHYGKKWFRVLDSSCRIFEETQGHDPESIINADARSVVVFKFPQTMES